MAKNRYIVHPCDNGGSVTNAKRDRQWDVIDTHNDDRCVSNHDTRKQAQDEARELNKNAQECKACDLRRSKGLQGQCPACANERAQTERQAPAGSEEHAKRFAAGERVRSAIEHLETARTQLDAALADISSIIGASSDCNRIRKISNELIEARRRLDENYFDSTVGTSVIAGRQWKLDHMPATSKNVAHGCSLATLIVIALAFVFAGCFGDDVHTRPDASPKYDACDPTISKDCPITLTDARDCQPTRLDAGSGQMCTEPCEQLGCTRDQYEPSCAKGGTVCECNGMQCVGTP